MHAMIADGSVDHPLVRRYRRTWTDERKIGMSLCSGNLLMLRGEPL